MSKLCWIAIFALALCYVRIKGSLAYNSSALAWLILRLTYLWYTLFMFFKKGSSDSSLSQTIISKRTKLYVKACMTLFGYLFCKITSSFKPYFPTTSSAEEFFFSKYMRDCFCSLFRSVSAPCSLSYSSFHPICFRVFVNCPSLKIFKKISRIFLHFIFWSFWRCFLLWEKLKYFSLLAPFHCLLTTMIWYL